MERPIVSATETKESTKREISIEVPAAEVQRETDALIQKYQKLARLPGFRKGHAPASIIRQRFSEDIKTEVVEALVPRYIRQEAARCGTCRTDADCGASAPHDGRASDSIVDETR